MAKFRILTDDEQSFIANALITARDKYRDIIKDVRGATLVNCKPLPHGLVEQFERQALEADRLAVVIQEYDWRGASEWPA